MFSAFENLCFDWFSLYSNFCCEKIEAFTGRVRESPYYPKLFRLKISHEEFSKKAFEATQQVNNMKQYQKNINSV